MKSGCSNISDASPGGTFWVQFMDPTRSPGDNSGGVVHESVKIPRSICHYISAPEEEEEEGLLQHLCLFIVLEKSGQGWRIKAFSALPTSSLIRIRLEIEIFYGIDSYKKVSNIFFTRH